MMKVSTAGDEKCTGAIGRLVSTFSSLLLLMLGREIGERVNGRQWDKFRPDLRLFLVAEKGGYGMERQKIEGSLGAGIAPCNQRKLRDPGVNWDGYWRQTKKR